MSNLPPGFPMVVPPPPLPPGWREHRAHDGIPFYYHAETNQSTYIRPLPPLPIPLQAPGPNSATPIAEEDSKKKKKKKEKPLVKTPIPGTEWVRVKTNEGNVFYTHKEKKESVWEVPEEISELVKEIEAKELQDEAERTIRDVEERVKGMDMTPPSAVATNVEGGKRKAEGDAGGPKAKAPKVVDGQSPTTQDENEPDEAEWQKEMAEEMLMDTRDADKHASEDNTMEVDSNKAKEGGELPKNFNMPTQVTLSTEEAKALFKTLLREKDVSPLTPYDAALPLLIQDPRYVLLPSITDRHAAFNEYCLEKSRALRAAKASSTSASTSVVDEKQKVREAFDSLLKAELTSTRTSWDEYKKKWKKDRRFFGFGRDDREREKVFRDFRSALGERKRQEAQKAEVNFFALLREEADAKNLITPNTMWKDVKRHKSIYSDPRYEAVGSSSLRQELFDAFLKSRVQPTAQPEPGPSNTEAKKHEDASSREQLKRERTEKALREREESARREKARVNKDIGRSRGNLNEERAVEDFLTLLTDAVRDPTATFQGSMSLLSRSPNFNNSPLPRTQQLALFNSHVSKLRQKQLAALYSLFEAYTPKLNARFGDLPNSVYTSAPAMKLGLGPSQPPQGEEREEGEEHQSNSGGDIRQMQGLWEEWQAERYKVARADFDKLLNESSFIEFWAGLGKMDKDKSKEKSTMGTVVPGVEDIDDVPADEDETAGGRTDLKTLAKGIGRKEMEDVLKNDKRFQAFAHIPEERQKWIEEHVSRMSAPKLSVHVGSGHD